MKIQYPSIIKHVGCERSFRYAVLHALCYRHTPGNDRAVYTHMFSIGYWTGVFVSKYGRIYYKHPEHDGIDFVKLATDEAKRLEKEIKDGR